GACCNVPLPGVSSLFPYPLLPIPWFCNCSRKATRVRIRLWAIGVKGGGLFYPFCAVKQGALKIERSRRHANGEV
ncbi:MAG TPA: hypothetical protein ACFYED_11360, partial [Candidatus Tripitaka californicus]|uniref:hypothetical protein n=1 Tax=Candidatus Tripitaka californicus TaxID=3367616 RepID=UPI004024BD8A